MKRFISGVATKLVAQGLGSVSSKLFGNDLALILVKNAVRKWTNKKYCFVRLSGRSYEYIRFCTDSPNTTLNKSLLYNQYHYDDIDQKVRDRRDFPDNFSFFYKGVKFFVMVGVTEHSTTNRWKNLIIYNSLSDTVIRHPVLITGIGNEDIARQFLQEFSVYVNEHRANTINIVTTKIQSKIPAWAPVGGIFSPTRLPAFDSVPMHSLVREKLLETIFFLKRKWTLDNDDLPSRGLFLVGVPGGGKTTLAAAVASELGTPLYLANRTTDNMGVFSLLLYHTPVRSTILFDDADYLQPFKNKDVQNNEKSISVIAHTENMKGSDDASNSGSNTVPVTTDDINNYLTGPSSPKGRLNIITTNYPEEINKSVVREGRVKDTIHVGPVDDAGIKRWLKHVHNYDVEDDVVFPERLVSSIYSLWENSDDDVEKFVHYLLTK